MAEVLYLGLEKPALLRLAEQIILGQAPQNLSDMLGVLLLRIGEYQDIV